MDRIAHRLRGVRFVASPNFNDRPDPADLSLLVIHYISLPPDRFGGPYVEQLFTNRLNPAEHPSFAELKALKVSAHLFIARDGTLTQFVPFHRRAWHAGVSTFEGRGDCNDFSIGIEIEGCETQRFEAAQYKTLVGVTKALLRTYPKLNASRIVGHSDIAPGRKTDPGPHFDWMRYRRAI